MLETAFTNHEFERLDMHEELSLVIICTAGIDGTVTDFRFKRIRMPECDRIDRLDIIVSVNKDCRKRRIYHLLAEYYRMPGGRIDSCFICTCLHEQFYKSFSTALHIRLVLLQGAD